MTKNTISKRTKKVGLLGTALVLVGGGVAFAYWTGTGSGTGSATTGTVLSALVVNQDTTVSNLRPGAAAQNLSGDFDNTNDEPVYVASVTAAISSVTDSAGDPIVGCDATDYTLANAVSTVNAEVPVGEDVGSWGSSDTPTLAFNNKATNQDACKLAVVHLAYTVS